MPIYTVQAPNGKTYKIEGPPGATAEQLGAVISQHDPSAGAKRKTITDRVKPEGALNTFLHRMGSSALADWGENIAAAVNTVAPGERITGHKADTMYGGEGFMKAYRANLARELALREADKEAHPGAAVGGEVAGFLVSPLNKLAAPIKGARLAARVGRVAAPAFAYGAAEGVHGGGNALQRLGRAAEGGVESGAGALALHGAFKGIGKAVGAVKNAGAERNALKRIAGTLGVRPEALKRVAQRIEQDRSAGGPSAEDIRAEMTKDRGKPTSLIDYAGENLKGFAGRIARTPGPARQIITEALSGRDKSAGMRIAGDIRRAISGGNADTTTQALIARRSSAARPLYEEAYAHPPMNVSALRKMVAPLMARPSMQKAIRNAYNTALEEGANPKKLGLALDDNGNPVLTNSWKALDYIKRGLDDVVEAYRDKTTGKLVLDTYGRAADETRTAFRTLLTKLNPTYGKALAAYSGPSNSIAALNMGKRALNMAGPEALSRAFKDLSANDREFFKMGVANDLLKRIAKTSVGGDESKRIIGNDFIQSMLRPLFKDESSFGKFIDSIKAEARMFATKQHVMGNSDTARRVAEDMSPMNQEVGRYAAHAVGHAVSHNPLGFVGNALKAFQASRAARDPAINAEVAKILTMPPDKAAKAIRLLSRKPIPPKTRNALAVLMKGGAVGNALRSRAYLAPVAAQQILSGGF